MNIMITGATGFVGTKLMHSLLEKGHNLFPVVRNEKKLSDFLTVLEKEKKDRIRPVFGDITQPMFGLSEEEVSELNSKVDILYHTAAYLSFDPDDREKTFFVNVEGTRHALDVAKKLAIPRFYHVSTAYTAGLENEADEKLHVKNREFVNDYEESKNHAEHLVMDKKDELKVSIFRPAIIVGDSETGEANTTFALYGLLKAVALLKKLIRRGRVNASDTIRLFSDPGASNNVVPVNHVVDVLTAAALHAKAGTIYHISNNHAPENKQVVEWIKEKSGVQNLDITGNPAELSEKDEVINAPMSVFHTYLSRTVTFHNRNTQQLLKDAGYPAFKLTDDQYSMMIGKYFE
ncbi:SDR family NAD(P)-dependent oxidoreductase [Jeotgalibacillus aurantiacus]|uniref:SDR family NAD(P)-dependent oxidoreductase n=1 Tax=Jeotgalibacillus aurantiacus TaxID=2763266 RepID=UPI001D0B746A|nr:SDR family NAD(P)-dependent oxidoreductase [Jeotgalibacillus aurantiacus]